MVAPEAYKYSIQMLLPLLKVKKVTHSRKYELFSYISFWHKDVLIIA
jgi:hypothetical protein